MLYYIKMKRRTTRGMDIDPVLCFGSFPYISTGFQFFNKDMFNRYDHVRSSHCRFFEEGRLDTLDFLEKFDKKSFKAAKKAADKREEKRLDELEKLSPGIKKQLKKENEAKEKVDIETEVVVQQ